MASCAHSVAAPAARSCARAVNARWGSSYPRALTLSPDCPGKLKSVQEWKKVASAREIGRY